jgi:hypothetical protein
MRTQHKTNGILTRLDLQSMYFHKLKKEQNERTELLEMRGAFSVSICTNSILLYLSSITYFNC